MTAGAPKDLHDARVQVSGVRLHARYALRDADASAAALASAIAVEQTIEFPPDLVRDSDIDRFVVGRVERLDQLDHGTAIATVSYPVEAVGDELPQLLNVLFGNCSLLPGVRLVDVALPRVLLSCFAGPRFGVQGVRDLLAAPHRPLLSTALKPMGLDAAALATTAHTLARAGVDIVKDDHGLANQPLSMYADRVTACATAVSEANAADGRRAIYAPCVNAPCDEIPERARLAKEVGAGGLLVLPGLSGFDAIRRLAADASLALPLIAHPAFLGSFVTDPRHGIEHGLLLGTLARLAGADMSIFPSYGGRFSFTQADCASIRDRCATPLGHHRPALPMPGGGMTIDRLPELIDFYGPDVVLLVGGDLHRGDLDTNARRMRTAVDRSIFTT